MAVAGPGIGGGELALRQTLESCKASIPQALGAFSQTTLGTRPSRGFLSWQECESGFQSNAKVEHIKPDCHLVECEGK